MSKSIELSQSTVPNRSRKMVLAAGIMSGLSLMGAHPDRASAKTHPKPTPATRLHQAEQAAKKSQRETDRLAEAIAITLSGSGVTKETVEGKGLHSQESLPGSGVKAGPEQKLGLEQASIHIVYRPKGSEAAWQDLCTGTKISYEGQNYVVSARHCFEDSVRNSNILMAPEWPAYDFLPTSNNEYAAVQEIGSQPFVHFDGLSMNIADDWALLRPSIPPKSDNGYDQFSKLR
jgi:hypothetical protein